MNALHTLWRNLLAHIGPWLQEPPTVRRVHPPIDATLVAAIEAVVEQIDPRMRAINGYRQKLSHSVAHSLSYIDELVAQAPGPLLVNRRTWLTDPLVNAGFATAGAIAPIFSRSVELQEFFAQSSRNEVYALLSMTRHERKVLGMTLQGDVVQRDVPQVNVSFTEHRIGAPADSETGVRNEMRKRALSYLVVRALGVIIGLRQQREHLEESRRLLQLKLKMLQARQGGLDSVLQDCNHIQIQIRLLQQKLAATEHDLDDVRHRLHELDDYIDHVNAVLDQPQAHLAGEIVDIRINRLGVKLPENSTEPGHKLQLAECFSPIPATEPGVPVRRVMVIVQYPREEMLSAADLFRRADRYLNIH